MNEISQCWMLDSLCGGSTISSNYFQQTCRWPNLLFFCPPHGTLTFGMKTGHLALVPYAPGMSPWWRKYVMRILPVQFNTRDLLALFIGWFCFLALQIIRPIRPSPTYISSVYFGWEDAASRQILHKKHGIHRLGSVKSCGKRAFPSGCL